MQDEIQVTSQWKCGLRRRIQSDRRKQSLLCGACTVIRSWVLYIPVLFLLLTAASARAVTYYVSASEGSDAYDGRSENTPWKSIAKVNSAQLAPGDSLLFRRGDVWKDAVLLYFMESGTAEQPIFIGSYGMGDRPIITDITPLAESGDSLRWITTGGNIWRIRCAETPGRLWLDGIEVLRAPIAADVGTTNSQSEFEWWHHSSADSTLLLYSPQNPATVWRLIEGNHPAGVMALYRCEHIIIDGLDFRGGRWSTVYGGACAWITFRNCSVGYGHSGLTLTSSDTVASAHHVMIENCTFDSGMRFRYGLSSLGASSGIDATKRGSEDGIHFGGSVNNCVVRNSNFTGWGHVAINCYAPDSTRDGVYANLFHDNSFTGSNISYARPFATDGAEGKCHHNEFRGNVIKDHTVRSQINGSDNWVHHNIFDGMTTSPAKYFGTEGSGQGILMSVYGQNLVCRSNRIEHNLFLRTSEAAVALWSHGFPNKVRGNLIRNNIFFDTGYATAHAADSGVAVLMRDTLEVFGNVVQNNCMYSPRSSEYFAVKYYGTMVSAGQFNLRDGRHGNTISGNFQADPLFVNPAVGDYHLRTASPCIDAGMRIPDITRDLEGNPVYSGTTPDVGPYEYTGPSSVNHIALPSFRSAVYPNPCRGEATITIQTRLRNLTLEVYNIRGELVTERRDISGDSIMLRTENLPHGIYYYRVMEPLHVAAAGVFVKH